MGTRPHGPAAERRSGLNDLHMDVATVLQSPDEGDHLPPNVVCVFGPLLARIERRVLTGDALEANDRLGANRGLTNGLGQIVERRLAARVATLTAPTVEFDGRQGRFRLQQNGDLVAERLGATRTVRAGFGSERMSCTDRINIGSPGCD